MNGNYDLDGKCNNCGQYHPCNCENDSDADNTQIFQFDNDSKITQESD